MRKFLKFCLAMFLTCLAIGLVERFLPAEWHSQLLGVAFSIGWVFRESKWISRDNPIPLIS